MWHAQTINRIRTTLCDVFAQLDAWFEQGPAMRQIRPVSGGWSIDEVLEHVTLTNHFLMLTLRKWAEIAEHRASRGDQPLGDESDLDRIEIIGERGSFGWERPEHMEPTGTPANEVRTTLQSQLDECLILLQRLENGRGALCQITMTVNDLGKIDLYQWLYFLVQHARRHLQQIAAIYDKTSVDAKQIVVPS